MRVLILGGTTEASLLSRALAGDDRFNAVLSLAGRTKAPILPNGMKNRIGGFGGCDGLQSYLADEKIGAVVDATHPYATRMSANAIVAAERIGCPLLRLTRPPWVAEPGDRWTMVASMSEAVSVLGTQPRRVLLTVGRQDLAPFLAAPWHRYVIRSVDPPDDAIRPPEAEIISARGPFALADEIDFLRARGIERLVTKNSGGDATRGKLLAARQLGIGVVMVARPPEPAALVETAEGTAAAMAWLGRHHAAQAVGASPARPSRTIA